MTPPFPYIRLIAIDPWRGGFGFAVLEGPRRLVDWGVAHVNGRDKNTECLKRFEYLVEQYRPQAVALEDCSARECQRRHRTRLLITQMAEYATFFDIPVIFVPWQMVRLAVGDHSAATKEKVGAAVAGRFPELAHRLPPHRKVYMSEDPRMSIFDATALAMTALHVETTVDDITLTDVV